MSTHPQAELYARLVDRFRAGALPASILLSGPAGVGKWKLAFDLAKRITCLLATSDLPCGTCAACRQLDNFGHPDVQFLFPLPADDGEWDEWFFPYLQKRQLNAFSPSNADPKHLIPIAGIRQFQSRLATRATLSTFKVGIIAEAERMLPGTMDSLLKLLEEPPEQTYLLVITDQPRVLLPTILSRLQRVNVPRLNDQYVRDYFVREHHSSAENARIMARLARGTLNRVEGFAEGEFFRLRESAWEMLSAATQLQSSHQVYFKFAESAALANRERVESMISYWQQFLRDLALFAEIENDRERDIHLLNFDMAGKYRDLLGRLATVHALYGLSDRLEVVRKELRRNVNARIAALDFLMQLPLKQSAAKAS